MYQCQVQLWEVVSSKNVLIVTVEEIKHWLCLHFIEHNCGMLGIRLENLEDVLLNVLGNKTVISCLFNSACFKGAVCMCVCIYVHILLLLLPSLLFPPAQESGLFAFLSDLQ